MGKRFKYYQPNKLDLRDKSADSTIRCFCCAEDKNWIDVFDSMYPYIVKFQRLSFEKEVQEAYMKDHGYIRRSFSRGEKRPTVDEFAKSNPTGTYILVLSGYRVCVKDGLYYDTVDVGDCKLHSYWEKK